MSSSKYPTDTSQVASAPGSESRFPKDSIVATAMGGMGRVYDGGYSEYTCVPASQVQVLPAPLTIPWSTFGALPEMMQTAYGSLSRTLRLQKGDRLLIRGGTTSVGLAAAAIAKSMGAKVAATTRRKDREELLHEYGAEEVLIDDGKIASQIQGHGGTVEKFDKVLELVGTSTLKDSLKLVKEGGICCVTGIVGGKWEFDAGDNPMELIPLGVYLSVYGGGPDEFMSTPLAEFVKGVEKGEMKIKVGRTFKLEEVAEAHRCMEANEAGGKIVVLVD